MSNPNPLATAIRAPRWLRWIGFLALAGYAVFLARNFSGVAGGADSSGYLNSARLLASGHLTAEPRIPPEFGPQEKLHRQQFQPHGFAPFEGNPRLSPTYAVGLPLHLALAGKLFGWSAAPAIVGITTTLAALLLCYAIGRQLGLDPLLAAAGATVLAAYPVFLFMSIQPLSDLLATTWCLAAIAAALRARDRAGWAFACGVAFAMAVFVRATNALLLLPLVIFLGVDLRRLGLAALGGLPGALWLGYYNHVLYGGALRSGYVNIAEAFAWRYGGPTAVHFAKWLIALLPAAVVLVPLIALPRREFRTRAVLALAVWFFSFTGLYTFYEISHEVWWDLRFILPATPALILAALLGVEALMTGRSIDARRRIRTITAAVVVSWAVALGWFWTEKFHLLLTRTYERDYADASALARRHFPPGTLVIASFHSGAIYYYTDFPVLRWEFVNATEFAHYRALAAKAGRTIAAVLYNVEERDALQEHCPGEWKQVAGVNNVHLWQLEPAREAVAK